MVGREDGGGKLGFRGFSLLSANINQQIYLYSPNGSWLQLAATYVWTSGVFIYYQDQL